MVYVTVKGGTRAGCRKPMAEGHGPRCVCSRCSAALRAAAKEDQ